MKGSHNDRILASISANARAFLDLEGQSCTRIQGLSLDGQGPRMHGIYVSQLGILDHGEHTASVIADNMHTSPT